MDSQKQPTHRYWIMLKYWQFYAPREKKDLYRLPACGYGPESMALRGIDGELLDFIEDAYHELRDDIRKALLH